jgi:phage-related protein (TIGR01555 family)
MLNKITGLFGRKRKARAPEAKQEFVPITDPLDPMERVRRQEGWTVTDGERILTLRGVDSFPMAELEDESHSKVETISGTSLVMDSAVPIAKTYAMDDSCGTCDPSMAGTMQTPYAVPEQLMNWYLSQSFIGYQACALIAQHWLVDKACSMPGEDAVRNGWTLKAVSEDEELDDATRDELERYDLKFRLVENLKQLVRFKNIFGIRVAIFEVESDDERYYEKPFNIDGVTKGSYKGISQVDPYWMMPMLTAEATADPSSIHFYEPEYWIISGKKYHRSHLIIVRGPEPADILKPTYIFGGIPLTQRIYERVYAAERTANEAPLLATNKRTTAIHVDTEKAILNEDKFIAKLKFWVKYRDNHAVKVLGKEETMEQFDTSLADFDAVIMNQYQLVSAIGKVPATKLLGTSPKGFNSTGEFETINYHEELESIQKHDMSPLLDRHYMLLEKSLGLTVKIQHVWEPVDSMTAKQRAELNLTKAQTGVALVESGALSPDEERNRIRDDKYSGYNRLGNDDGNSEPGMSPDVLAELEKAGAQQEKSKASLVTAGARQEEVNKGSKIGMGANESAEATEVPPKVAAVPEVQEPAQKRAQQEQTTMLDPAAAGVSPAIMDILGRMTDVIERLSDEIRPEGVDIRAGEVPGRDRAVKPGVASSVRASTHGPLSVATEQAPWKLPKIKLHGMTLAIENPRGTTRRGVTLDGDEWSVNMPHHYGFIKGFEGADGDEMDCFVGPNMKSQKAFIVNQNSKDGEFDEHKCMLGFDSREEAKEAYDQSYSEGWDGFDSIHELSMDDFKAWLNSKKAHCGPYTNEFWRESDVNPHMADGESNNQG